MIGIICSSVGAGLLGFAAWRVAQSLQPGEAFRFMETTMAAGGALVAFGAGLVFLFIGVLAFYKGESAWISDGRLFHSFRFWPFRSLLEYDLALIREVRAGIPAGMDQDYTVYFEYRGSEIKIGNNMLQRDADELVWAIIGAADRARAAAGTSVFDPVPARPAPPPLVPAPPMRAPGFSTALVVVAANFVPIAGVIFLGWKVEEVVILFWAESAVIGFYNLLKLGRICGPLLLVTGPVFIGHFGVFMAAHFWFLYMLFFGKAGDLEPRSVADVLRILLPLWPALFSYFISHGISFWTNFLGRREYAGRDVKTQMREPYRRIVIMHLAIIGGFWVTILVGGGGGFLLALVLLKLGFDLHGHLRERARAALRTT